jgi:capsular exopolysaccharide synthesis family protein
MAVKTDTLPPSASAGSLSRVGPGGALANPTSRDWVLPATDEVFRGIYTRAGTGASEVLAITSAIAGEGKSTVSLGLAVTVAQDFPERRVLLVETDLQNPSLARDFDFDPSPGLINYLLDDEPLESLYRSTAIGNLSVLPSGGQMTNPGRLLRSSLMAAAVATMRDTHDLVILDLTSILVNSDTLPVADLADGVIVVVRAGVTPTSLVNKAVKLLDENKLLGVVLNGARSAIPGWLRRLGRM